MFDEVLWTIFILLAIECKKKRAGIHENLLKILTQFFHDFE